MNGILNRRALELLGLGGTERVLELGAGTSIFAAAMAAELPSGSVLAIERDEHQVAGGRARAEALANLELRQGDAAVPPLAESEWGAFDVVHARFLLEHVEDPLSIVRTMVRAVRPGGRVVLVDDDHSLLRLWPEPAGVLELWQVYVAQYEAHGMDPYVGRKLAALLSEAGARPDRSAILHYGAVSGEAHFEAVVENLAEVFEGVSDKLVASGGVTRSDFEACMARLRAWSRGSGHAVSYGLPWIEGTR